MLRKAVGQGLTARHTIRSLASGTHVGHNRSFARVCFAKPLQRISFLIFPSMPELLRALLALEFDYADGDGIDFEPYDAFFSEEETRDWFQAWTGNNEVDGAEFQVFGQDGSGGYAAIWTVRQDSQLLDQPVVFLGSEGETGVVASSVNDFLWLLAAFAKKHSPQTKKSALDVLARAKAEFPDFEQRILAACR
jgi:hypothetical protein